MSDLRFSDALLDELRAKVSISEIVGSHVAWDKKKSTRDDFWACCPFHGENSPSFHADDRKGIYHCFGCGVTGDHFRFLTEQTGCSFPDAVRTVAELAGVSLPDAPGGAPQPRQEPRQAPTPAPEAPPAQGKRVMAATYDYVSADGELLYQVTRWNIRLPDGTLQRTKNGKGVWKTFIQRRPSHIGDGSWVWGLSEGEFMRPGPGKDWRSFDEEKFAEWSTGERRWFDSNLSHTIYRRQQVEIAIAEGKTIFLPEGEKDVETLEGWGLVASTNSGGAANWTPALAELFRDADVVILGDDDEAGQKRVDAVGLSLRGIARRVRAVRFWDGKKDVTDWKEAGGDASKLGEILNTLPDWRPAPPTSGMGAVGVHQLHDPSLKHEFLIDGFLDRQGVGMMPGASGSGKTFLILEMSMCVATGMQFWGMDVKQGVVLYQAGEGKQGVTKRLDAWLQDRGIAADASIPFQMLTKRVNLFVDDKDTDAIIAEGKAWAAFYGQPVRLVVIDTFNKAITGANENAGQDMGKVLSRMERISTELDCCVVSPIHKSKEGNMRGHTSLMGDVSNVINVSELQLRDHNSRIIRTVALDKNKDGEKGKPLRFVLRQVVLGEDEKGKPITTCVVDRPDGDEEEYARQGKLSMNQVIALKALRQAVEDRGETAPAGIRAGAAVKLVAKNQHWKDRFKAIFPNFGSDDPEKREAEAKRLLGNAGKVLLAGDYIGVDNERGISWPTGRDDRPKREPKPIEKAAPSPLMTKEDFEVPF